MLRDRAPEPVDLIPTLPEHALPPLREICVACYGRL